MALLQLQAAVDVMDDAPEHAGRMGIIKEISDDGDKILVKLGKYGQRWLKTENVWFARNHLKAVFADVVFDQATFSVADLGSPPAKRPKVRLDAPHRPRCISSAVLRVPVSALTPRLFFSGGRAHGPPWR